MRNSFFKLCLVVISCLFISACDSNDLTGDETTGLELGKFEFSVQGDFTVNATGEATYFEDPDWGENGYTDFRMRGDGDVHMVLFSRTETDKLKPGVYRIVDPSEVVSDPLEPHEFEADYFNFSDDIFIPDRRYGTVTIYQVEEERMEGRFKFNVEGYYLNDRDKRVSYSVSGAFNASQYYVVLD